MVFDGRSLIPCDPKPPRQTNIRDFLGWLVEKVTTFSTRRDLGKRELDLERIEPMFPNLPPSAETELFILLPRLKFSDLRLCIKIGDPDNLYGVYWTSSPGPVTHEKLASRMCHVGEPRKIKEMRDEEVIVACFFVAALAMELVEDAHKTA